MMITLPEKYKIQHKLLNVCLYLTLYGNLIVYSTDTFSEHMSNKSISTPININGNISYEGVLKHRTYRCDSLMSFFIYGKS
jgi:hypothetical protein